MEIRFFLSGLISEEMCFAKGCLCLWKRPVCKWSLGAGLFWKVVDGGWRLLVSAIVGENWRILREIDEYLRVLSCWDSAVFCQPRV